MGQQPLQWQQLQQHLSRLLAPAGFSIVHPFSVQIFNDQGCPPEHQLPTFSRKCSTLGIIIGNTNELWGPFIQHLAAEQQAQHALTDNPLDAYVEQKITHILQQCCTAWPGSCITQVAAQTHSSTQHQHQHQHLNTQHTTSNSSSSSANEMPGTNFIVRFSHHTEPGKFVNMMRAAQLSGLAYYSSTTHLCMHPEYGPWFALRAVAVIDMEGPDPRRFSQLSCPHPDLEDEAAKEMKRLESLGGLQNWHKHWRDWANLRAMGGAYTDPRYAYSPEQLEYHYTKSKTVLAKAIDQYSSTKSHTDRGPEPEQHATCRGTACEHLSGSCYYGHRYKQAVDLECCHHRP